MNKRYTAFVAMKKLKHEFPNTGYAMLWYSVLNRTVVDLFNPVRRSSALNYLAGNINAAEICGVDSDYVRRVLIQAGLINEIDLKKPAALRKAG